ncbi:glycosyltransferase family 2 protein [Paraprevotella xylaniphila]|jgi:glycosyltransferase involved in cell wall biosynthesis|uniref:glycosyltransferase family 2 protein n=1 Tax=Paraprevotella xylaniphila TaxID=454155 RepID=UPI0024A9FA79|nr:glycosyltransferase family 2 protein [Paraprevotella xylaniphila]
MLNPAISIIVPVFNAAQYLQECLDSILSQSFNDFELILIDDGSTDNSLSICQSYERRDSRIKTISGPNQGVSAARNKGLNVACGEWITFVDADDCFLHDALQTLYNRAMCTGADLVLANALRLKDGNLNKILSLSNEVLSNVICSIKHFALWGYLFNGQIIRQNRLKFIEGLAYSEDRIFIYQISMFCKTIAYCVTPVYVYRINDNSACASPDGVRKACHHIDAAYYLKQFALTYQLTNKSIYRCLRKQSWHVMELGMYFFVAMKMSSHNNNIVLTKYKERFGNGLCLITRYYVILLHNFIKYQRRKIIRFKR